MPRLLCFLFVCGSLALSSFAQPVHRLHSPTGTVEVALMLDAEGRPTYAVAFEGRSVIEPSALGFTLRDAAPLDRGFAVDSVTTRAFDETWRPLWGTSETVRNHYTELTLHLREEASPGRRLAIVVRAFDDGVGLRYVFPEQPGLASFAVTDEHTTFRLASDATAWWIPGDPESYEHLYRQTPASAIDLANTAVAFRFGETLYAALHEADLTDYPGMRLAAVPGEPGTLKADLVPLPETDGVRAFLEAPFATPWRTILLGRSAGDLMTSDLVLNLNDPCAICEGDTSWIDPAKYVGVWWTIHKGEGTWAPGPNVSATTAATKRYIDFAARHGIPYVLAEGWNEGWAGDWTGMDFTTAQPAFDLEEVVAYGRERGVGFIAHMETGANVAGMEAQLDTAFALYARLGIHAIKTGYVGEIAGHHHHDQWMVNHYQRVVERAAAHRIMVNAHEPIKPTGKRRTYPNMMTREGVRGMEWNAWSDGNPPSHTLILPFTRLIGGPVDYTPGIFNIRWSPEKVADSPFAGAAPTRVHTTRARQLALYVLLFSGLQMVTDVPEHYEGEPAFAFIEQVPVTWDETRVLEAEIGERLVVARRSGHDWYVGAGTDATPRTLTVPLAFLPDGVRYRATLYTDAPETDLETNPEALQITEREVTYMDQLTLRLAAGGGAAVRLTPIAE